MALRLLYLIVIRVFGWLALVTAPSRESPTGTGVRVHDGLLVADRWPRRSSRPSSCVPCLGELPDAAWWRSTARRLQHWIGRLPANDAITLRYDHVAAVLGPGWSCWPDAGLPAPGLAMVAAWPSWRAASK
jgi:hypothetical protein